jgi:hypothetical protein
MEIQSSASAGELARAAAIGSANTIVVRIRGVSARVAWVSKALEALEKTAEFVAEATPQTIRLVKIRC